MKERGENEIESNFIPHASKKVKGNRMTGAGGGGV
jgi:hypothetical protein